MKVKLIENKIKLPIRTIELFSANGPLKWLNFIELIQILSPHSFIQFPIFSTSADPLRSQPGPVLGYHRLNISEFHENFISRHFKLFYIDGEFHSYSTINCTNYTNVLSSHCIPSALPASENTKMVHLAAPWRNSHSTEREGYNRYRVREDVPRGGDSMCRSKEDSILVWLESRVGLHEAGKVNGCQIRKGMVCQGDPILRWVTVSHSKVLSSILIWSE